MRREVGERRGGDGTGGRKCSCSTFCAYLYLCVCVRVCACVCVLRLLGHLSRMDDSCLPKQLLVCALVGGTAVQLLGQKYRWNDLVSIETLQGEGCWKIGVRGHVHGMLVMGNQEEHGGHQ